jgi:AcrR family transcriptional regulator
MKKEERPVRERLIQATRDLLTEGTDLHELSIRQIARRAHVNSAMINYYFQTKEKLMTLAIQEIIQTLASTAEANYREAGTSPYERIKQRGREVVHFIVQHPGMSKVIMLQALEHPHPNDTMAEIARLLEDNLREYYGDRKNERQIAILAMQIMAPLHLWFMRSQVMDAQCGLNLYDEEQRIAFMDELVDNVLKEGNS